MQKKIQSELFEVQNGKVVNFKLRNFVARSKTINTK